MKEELKEIKEQLDQAKKELEALKQSRADAQSIPAWPELKLTADAREAIRKQVLETIVPPAIVMTILTGLVGLAVGWGLQEGAASHATSVAMNEAMKHVIPTIVETTEVTKKAVEKTEEAAENAKRASETATQELEMLQVALGKSDIGNLAQTIQPAVVEAMKSTGTLLLDGDIIGLMSVEVSGKSLRAVKDDMVPSLTDRSPQSDKRHQWKVVRVTAATSNANP